MQKSLQSDRAIAFFTRVLDRGVILFAIATVVIVLSSFGMTKLVKNPSTDALIPPGHPSLQARDAAKEIFGLSDPIAVALVSDGPNGVFTPETLAVLQEAHATLEEHPNIRADRVVSIASESRIHGTDDALRIDRFLEGPVQDASAAAAVRDAVMASRLHKGILVSEDGSGALIVGEFFDEALIDETYREIKARMAELETEDTELLVAGQGAVTGYLSGLLDRDARILSPLSLLVIFVLVFAAFGRASPLLGLLAVMALTLAGSIGVMAWMGIEYYVITNVLPVILVAIAMADSLHIFTGYFERRAALPEESAKTAMVQTLADLWRPLTLTTLTTMAGFAGIGLASGMPPMAYFGWFAALGSFMAWAGSLFVLPVILVWLKVPAARWGAGNGTRGLAHGLTATALRVSRSPKVALGALAAFAAVALFQAQSVEINRNQIENFRSGQPIRVAEEIVNDRFSGSSYLDVVVETDAVDGLLDADRMKRIADLQDFLEGQPYVQKTLSIADYVSELHTALNGTEAGAMPDSDSAVAQYLLLFEASGDPADLEEEIDLDYRRAHVRAYMNALETKDREPAVEALERYLADSFNTDGLSGTISGRVNVDYHWMAQLAPSHKKSVIFSLVFVFGIAALLFRSAIYGLLALVPVALSLVAVYALMGTFDIYIEPATSTFGAIAIGVGIDFAIHFIDRMRKGTEENGMSVRDTIRAYYPASARACFLNAGLLMIGFGMLFVSELPTLFRLGLLICVATLSSFIAGFVVVTATFAIRERLRGQAPALTRVAAGVIALCLLSDPAADAHATEVAALDGRAIAERIDSREDGSSQTRTIAMTLTNKRGRSREREAVAMRRDTEDGTQSVIFYTAPKALRDTAFLNHDAAAGASADRQWLYLPAARRPKQIPASDRGEYFLGTDFTYEDIRSELKFDLDDYDFVRGDAQAGDTFAQIRLTATPKSDTVARQLGYGRVEAVIDTESWIPRELVIFDPKDRLLKTVRVTGVEQIDGIWAATRIEAEQHQTGHKTVFAYRDTAFGMQHKDRVFTPQGLRQGAP